MRLNLGCSDRHMPGYCNVDLAPPCDQAADLRRTWPWEDSTIEVILAHDIFEHLPDKIHTLNEAWRVLRPGGTLHMIVPTTDGRGAWQDPTHVSFWNPNSLFYLEAGNPHNTRFRDAYGMRHAFRIVRQQHEKLQDNQWQENVWKLDALLEAVK